MSTIPGPTHETPSSVDVKGARAATASNADTPSREGLPPELLERARARDPEALAVFFDRYFDLVFGLVQRLLGDRTSAEDVTQEVFIKVHRAIDRLDPARDPAPWLAAIATNACRDVWRSGAWRLGRRTTSLDDDSGLAETLGSRAADPERVTVVRERERLVREALATLPPPLREAVVLHEYQGLPHDEIATILGIDHAAARKRYSRALAALAARLKGMLE